MDDNIPLIGEIIKAHSMVTETRLSQDIIRAYETQITKAFDWDLHLIVPL